MENRSRSKLINCTVNLPLTLGSLRYTGRAKYRQDKGLDIYREEDKDVPFYSDHFNSKPSNYRYKWLYAPDYPDILQFMYTSK